MNVLRYAEVSSVHREKVFEVVVKTGCRWRKRDGVAQELR